MTRPRHENVMGIVMNERPFGEAMVVFCLESKILYERDLYLYGQWLFLSLNRAIDHLATRMGKICSAVAELVLTSLVHIKGSIYGSVTSGRTGHS